MTKEDRPRTSAREERRYATTIGVLPFTRL
jgi:hypothetical protein